MGLRDWWQRVRDAFGDGAWPRDERGNIYPRETGNASRDNNLNTALWGDDPVTADLEEFEKPRY